MNNFLNMAWNLSEWMNSKRRPVDVLWLYTGFVNDSVLFNIVEYVFDRVGFIK